MPPTKSLVEGTEHMNRVPNTGENRDIKNPWEGCISADFMDPRSERRRNPLLNKADDLRRKAIATKIHREKPKKSNSSPAAEEEEEEEQVETEVQVYLIEIRS